MAERETGTVKWFDPQQGYGFIERDNRGGDIFVHQSAISSQLPERILVEGQRVEFSIEMGNEGPRAEDVIPIRG